MENIVKNTFYRSYSIYYNTFNFRSQYIGRILNGLRDGVVVHISKHMLFNTSFCLGANLRDKTNNNLLHLN